MQLSPLQTLWIVFLLLSSGFVACRDEAEWAASTDAGVVQDGDAAGLKVDVSADLEASDAKSEVAQCGEALSASIQTWYDPWCIDILCIFGGLCKFNASEFADGGSGCSVAPEMCPRSIVCGHSGRCTYDPVVDYCRPTADSCSQCIGSTCGVLGEYVAGENDCVQTSQAHCKVTCAVFGDCHFDAKSGRCVAATDEDCFASELCLYYGRCGFDPSKGQCVETTDRCPDTVTCKEWGLSCGSEYGGSCNGLWTRAKHVLLPEEPTPVVPPGLLPAQECKPKVSIASCPSEELCVVLGLCGWDGARCIPRDVHDCRLSMSCGLFGWCGVVGDRCGAVLDEDCVRCAPPRLESNLTSIHCSRTGDPIMGRCVPQIPSDCWYDCSQYGHCALDEGRCVATNDFACTWSVRCEEEGACVVDPRTRECAIPLGKP
jgi:hypothetical protein